MLLLTRVGVGAGNILEVQTIFCRKKILLSLQIWFAVGYSSTLTNSK